MPDRDKRRSSSKKSKTHLEAFTRAALQTLPGWDPINPTVSGVRGLGHKGDTI